MTFGSVFFGNSKGTLNNDMSINTPSDGVNIALHNIDGSTIKQVQINNPERYLHKKRWTLRLNLQPMILKHPMSVLKQARHQLLVMLKPTLHIPLLTSNPSLDS